LVFILAASRTDAYMSAIPSPCTRICSLNPATGLCRGCGRTIEEIAGWAALSDAERARIMTLLPERLAAARAAAV
jgi:predicted Fe-S protein YdhL (DUF1289 family)